MLIKRFIITTSITKEKLIINLFIFIKTILLLLLFLLTYEAKYQVNLIVAY